MISTLTTKSHTAKRVIFTDMQEYCQTVTSVDDDRFDKKGIIVCASAKLGQTQAATLFIDGLMFTVTGDKKHEYVVLSSYLLISKALDKLLDPASYERVMRDFTITVAHAYELLNQHNRCFVGSNEQFAFLNGVFGTASVGYIAAVSKWRLMLNIKSVYDLISNSFTHSLSPEDIRDKAIPIIKALLYISPVEYQLHNTQAAVHPEKKYDPYPVANAQSELYFSRLHPADKNAESLLAVKSQQSASEVGLRTGESVTIDQVRAAVERMALGSQAVLKAKRDGSTNTLDGAVSQLKRDYPDGIPVNGRNKIPSDESGCFYIERSKLRPQTQGTTEEPKDCNVPLSQGDLAELHAFEVATPQVPVPPEGRLLGENGAMKGVPTTSTKGHAVSNYELDPPVNLDNVKPKLTAVQRLDAEYEKFKS